MKKGHSNSTSRPRNYSIDFYKADFKLIPSTVCCNPGDMSKKDKAMKTDSFATHFAKICGDCKNSNAVKAKLKEAISVKVIWQGDGQLT